MIHTSLILEKANDFRSVVRKKAGRRMGVIFLSLILLFIVSNLFYPVMAQQMETDIDTVSQNIDIPFFINELQGFSPKLTSSQIGVFGDFSVAEALVRLPGIYNSRDGELNIRGVGFENYSVFVDGLRLANTGMGTREVDLGALSTDTFSEIQVTKVTNPSMDADALGGSVNLHTKQTGSDKRTLNAILGGGANFNYISRAGPSGRGVVHYSEQFNDEVSVSANLNYQLEQNTREELKIGYSSVNFGNGEVDVIEQVSPSLQNDGRGRFSASVNTNYTPTQNSNYYLRGFLNSEARKRVKHEDSWITNGDWIDQFTTGAEGEQGTYTHAANHQNIDITQFTFQGGGENKLESLILSYKAGWSLSRVENSDYLFPFQIDGLNYSIDMSNRNYPQFEVTNRPLQVLEDGTIDRQFMMAQNFNRITEEHISNEYSARIDVEYPIEIGSVKAGSSIRLAGKEGEYDNHSFEYYRASNLRMINFNMMKEPIRNIDVIHINYRIPWFVNTEHTRAFLENQRPLFSSNENLYAFNSGINNYETNDQIYAAYLMGDLEFGRLQVMGGVRVEQASFDFNGRQVVFDETGNHVETNTTEESNDNFQFFPNAQLIFSPSSQNKIHLAYSRTIDRPDYSLQTPFERIHNQDSVISRGNHQLEPVFSNNIDLMLDQKIGNTGLVTAGGFYKELSNLIVQRELTLSSGQYEGYREFVYANRDESASVFGFELGLQQSLSFLPGLLNNFGVYANYTWSESSYETQRGDETALPGHSPHIVNAALSYTQGRFFGQIKYHWSADLLQELKDHRELTAASDPTDLDRYEDGFQDLSASVNFRLSERFRFWAYINNLLQTDQVRYAYDKQLYPTSTYVQDGIELRFGIRFNL